MEVALSYLIPAFLVLGTVCFMEWFATWSHEHVMHGWGWGWHKSHHEDHDDTLEGNDLYALVFGAFATSLYWIGYTFYMPIWWIAVGMTLYGILYFFDGPQIAINGAKMLETR